MYNQLKITRGSDDFNPLAHPNYKKRNRIVHQIPENNAIQIYVKRCHTVQSILRTLSRNIRSDQFTLASRLCRQLNQ